MWLILFDSVDNRFGSICLSVTSLTAEPIYISFTNTLALVTWNYVFLSFWFTSFYEPRYLMEKKNDRTLRNWLLKNYFQLSVSHFSHSWTDIYISFTNTLALVTWNYVFLSFWFTSFYEPRYLMEKKNDRTLRNWLLKNYFQLIKQSDSVLKSSRNWGMKWFSVRDNLGRMQFPAGLYSTDTHKYKSHKDGTVSYPCVPRRNFVAEGGYCITLCPAVHLSGFNDGDFIRCGDFTSLQHFFLRVQDRELHWAPIPIKDFSPIIC